MSFAQFEQRKTADLIACSMAQFIWFDSDPRLQFHQELSGMIAPRYLRVLWGLLWGPFARTATKCLILATFQPLEFFDSW
jgi:phage terminase large subunit-like protein